MTTRLVLIRHGITKWNQERRYCGDKDVFLSPEGKIQARRLRACLKNIKFDKIYASDKKRALQTAKIIFKNTKIKKMKGLKEIGFGVLEGLNFKEIKSKYNDIYKKWLTNPYRYHIPGAEPLSSFKKRICCTIKKIIRNSYGQNIAVVCHGGTIGMLIGCICKNNDFWSYVPSAASITIVEYKNRRPKVIQFNETKHLK